MIKKFWCFLWGHKFLAKAFTGNSMQSVGAFGNEYTVALYRWEIQRYCTRCGCRNPDFEQIKKEPGVKNG